ncbi:MAG: S8 family serine peptidase [Solirubrobacterales bacterium]
MPPGKTLRARAGMLSIAVVILACSPMPAFAFAASSSPRGGTLSPRLAALAKPSVLSLPPFRQARVLSLARSGPGSLLRKGSRVVADVRFEHGAAAGVPGLREAGAEILNVSSRYQTVTVAAKPADLRAIAGVVRVAGVTEVLAPLVFAGAGCPSGVAVSAGDGQLQAAEARRAFNVDGSGVTVGILSDSFDQAALAADGSGPVATHAAEDVTSGDLPGSGNPCGQTTPVNVLENDAPEFEKEEPTDEGRGMAQIVHDLAPGAKLAFASAINGPFAFASNIERLARSASEGGAGAQVIADDVAYFEEPFFQDGPIAVAVDRAAAAGAAYFSAAGNDNLIDAEGHEIASWEAPEFRNPGSCPAGVPVYAGRCVDFGPGPADRGFEITVEPEATVAVDLQWAQPWFGVTTDLDAYLLNKGVEVAESQSPNTDPGIQEPVEILGWTNPSSTEPATVELAINRCEAVCGSARALANPELAGTTGGDAGTPRLKFALLGNGGGVSETEYPTSSGGDTVGPTIFGHSGASSAVSVGAVPFYTNSEPEEYSSRGPVKHYFGAVEGASPALKLPSVETLSKPDVAATDCGVTTFFARFGSFFGGEAPGWHFCGTSAAAPHAAAVAALMRQANSSLTPDQIRSGLIATARPVGTFGADAVGAGLVDAFPALAATARPPAITITQRPAAVSKDRSPSIGFTANRPVSFACSLDGRPLEACASPFVPSSPLADGQHGFAVRGVDAAGLSGTSETVLFTVDTKPPNTFFRKHPRKVIRTRHRRARAVFRVASNEKGVRFVCRVDGGLLRFCSARFVRRFGEGAHIVRVMAQDQAGNVDRTPAVFRFRVKRIH